MALKQAFKLKGGASIPSIGLGTWQAEPGKVRAAVSTAINVGYRHIDAAWIYGNEPEVGQGIRDTSTPRDDLWITSKLWNGYHRPEHVEMNLDETLENLNLDYLDLYLMHWPVAYKTIDGKPQKRPQDKDGKVMVDRELSDDFLSTWQAMEKLVTKGKVRHIGISNFNIRRMKELLANASVHPVVNQVELNFSNPQAEFMQWCHANEIVPQAYSPLGGTGAKQADEPAIVEMAKKLDVTPAQILISWQIQRGAVCLPKSVTKERIESNFRTVELPEDDFEQLEKASRPSKRTLIPPWAPDVFEDDHPENSDKAQARKG